MCLEADDNSVGLTVSMGCRDCTQVIRQELNHLASSCFTSLFYILIHCPDACPSMGHGHPRGRILSIREYSTRTGKQHAGHLP